MRPGVASERSPCPRTPAGPAVAGVSEAPQDGAVNPASRLRPFSQGVRRDKRLRRARSLPVTPPTSAEVVNAPEHVPCGTGRSSRFQAAPEPEAAHTRRAAAQTSAEPRRTSRWCDQRPRRASCSPRRGRARPGASVETGTRGGSTFGGSLRLARAAGSDVERDGTPQPLSAATLWFTAGRRPLPRTRQEGTLRGTRRGSRGAGAGAGAASAVLPQQTTAT